MFNINYINFGYNFLFKKFYLFFFFNKIIFKSKRFIYLSGSEKFESIFNNLNFFYNIKYGFTRYNYIVPLISKTYDFNVINIPAYNIFFYMSFRLLYFKILRNYFIFLFLFFYFFNFKFFYNFIFKFFFFFNFLNLQRLRKKKFFKNKRRFYKTKFFKRKTFYLKNFFLFSKNFK